MARKENRPMDKVKAIKKASRELHRGMPKGGAMPSKKDKARRRNKKHPNRSKEDW